MSDYPTREDLERARAVRAAKTCACCGDADDDGSVAYRCEVCGRIVCGLCLREEESGPLPVCMDCESPDADPEADRFDAVRTPGGWRNDL